MGSNLAGSIKFSNFEKLTVKRLGSDIGFAFGTPEYEKANQVLRMQVLYE